MVTNLPEDTVWAAGVAARLRLLQVSCAEAPAAQRQKFLRETLAQALEGMLAARRDNCLTALVARFPAWGATPSSPAPPPALTPEEMVNRLVTLAPQLSSEARAAFARQLQDGGLLPRPAPVAGEVLNDLQTKYGLPQPPSLEQVVCLLRTLADAVQELDDLACKTLKNLPSPSDTPPLTIKSLAEEDLIEGLKGFLSADDVAAPASLRQSLRKLVAKHRRGMGALMASSVGAPGVPGAGGDFANWFQKWFSPQKIADDTRAENPYAYLVGGGKLCWEKYQQRFEDMATPQRVDKQVKEAVAKTAERLFQL